MSFRTRSTASASGSSISLARRPPRTRSFARGSPRRCRTSCERLLRGCLRCWRRQCCPAKTRRPRRAGESRDRPDHRADRRGAVPQRARVGRPRRRAWADGIRPVLEEALGELVERAARAGVDLRLECDERVELAIRPRMLRVVARNLAENAIRYAGPSATFVLDVRGSIDGGASHRRPRRRDGCRGSRAAPVVRAVLSRGPRSGFAWNGARPRDRQARRDSSGRDGRGAGPARPRARRCAANFPPSRSPSPDLHHTFTTDSCRPPRRTETGGNELSRARCVRLCCSTRALLRVWRRQLVGRCHLGRRARARSGRSRRRRRRISGHRAESTSPSGSPGRAVDSSASRR